MNYPTIALLIILNLSIRQATAMSKLELPEEFQMKLKLWFHEVETPALVLLHYSNIFNAARMDFYQLTKTDPEGDTLDAFHHIRYYSEVHHWAKQKRFLIMHRQPKTPSMCIITTPFKELQPHTFLDRAQFHDLGYVPLHLNSIEECTHARLSHNVDLGSFSQVDMCLNSSTGEPFLIHTPMFRAKVLHYKAISQPIQLFDAEKISHKSCSSMA